MLGLALVVGVFVRKGLRMSYSGAGTARQAREMLGQALAALQEDTNIPPDVMAVAQNIASAIGALFEAERASSEVDGKASVRAAIGSLSQTLALLQDVRAHHRGIQLATEVLARTMSGLYPLTTVPSKAPPATAQAAAPMHVPAAAPLPQVIPIGVAPQAQQPFPQQPFPQQPQQPFAQQAQQPFAQQPQARPIPQTAFQPPAPVQQAPAPSPVASRGGPRQMIEANVGATTETNFWVGFSGEIAEGGVFVATYNVHPKGTPVDSLVTLPGGFEFRVNGVVRFVRDPMDLSQESEPGMGVQFEGLAAEHRELVLRFIRKRPPIFYDD